MELNKIRIILDDSGGIDSLVTPVINQYATNYLIEVAFRNEYEDNRIYKVVFNINGKESPAKVLAPTDRYYDFEDGTKSAHFWEYKLTQYETQFYQDALEFTLIVENGADVITTQKISLVMNKQRFNKLTPVNLENDTSLNSVVYSVSNLDKVIDSRNDAAKEEILEETSKLDSELEIKLNARIIQSADELHNRIDGVEDYYNSEISRVDADINAGDTRLDEKIDEAVHEMSGYTDRQLTSYDEYAHDIFITGDDIQQDLYPYIDRKTAEAKSYTDEKITELVDSAPGTLNTLREIAEALKDQDDVITALEETIGNKADRDELDSKVSKVGERNILYGTDENGAEYYLTYSEYADGNARIPLRSSTGQLDVPEEPYSDRDAASKKYVDESIGNKLDKVTTASRIYATDSSGNQIIKEYVTNTPKASAVPIYNAYGNLQGYTAKNPYDLTNKSYVDSLFAGSVIERSESIISGLSMVNNTQYKCLTPLTTLDIDEFEAGTVAVGEQWSIIFTTAGAITVSLPENVKWAVAEPVFKPDKTYMLTFIRFLDNYLGVWTVV